ncbi:acetyl-CoA carboxylase biotin carboxylase subunit [Tepidiforma sp.]|uniref:acetyl-CoA carboxylase biotin carboxylase subunit n=1 Tax=Tepidiforma sp. TaxID=2682230 RepID=UPI002ADD5634|nr:acetyl-CoA carboxylase biotin carboxylase subunit [Tepidiforma sp.]
MFACRDSARYAGEPSSFLREVKAPTMFSKVLVANRGEIALRIVRGLRDLDIRSVAVYSEVDRLSQHVRYADEAHYIGPADARESYLNMERIIDVAKRCGADAIHPGYGFLAENAEFAEACEAAGLVFIGPSPESIRLLGDKIEARHIAERAGVPVLPGSGELTSVDEALAFAERIGYPVMIKAAAGGGGRGIRLIERPEDLPGAAARAMQEAAAAFGNPAIYVEKNLKRVRHIEVQVIGDRYGNIVPLGERECSIQRRHQKIIEECPSVAVGPQLRRTLSRAAVRIARAANYHNVGTVEFLLDQDGHHYFLEMNTRLQVEHPVTEIVTGTDLVKDQILVAAGEELPYEEADLLTRGWAIECRIVAEDPFNNFLPSVGRVVFAREPAGPGIRVESALYDGVEVTPYYDSLLAKVTAWGRNREGARQRMKRALAEFRVVGVATNIPYLQQILDLPDFISGNIDTGFLDRNQVLAEENYEEQRQIAEIAALLFVTAGERDNGEQPFNGQSVPSNGYRGTIGAWRRQQAGTTLLGGGMGRWPRSI